MESSADPNADCCSCGAVCKHQGDVGIIRLQRRHESHQDYEDHYRRGQASRSRHHEYVERIL